LPQDRSSRQDVAHLSSSLAPAFIGLDCANLSKGLDRSWAKRSQQGDRFIGNVPLLDQIACDQRSRPSEPATTVDRDPSVIDYGVNDRRHALLKLTWRWSSKVPDRQVYLSECMPGQIGGIVPSSVKVHYESHPVSGQGSQARDIRWVGAGEHMIRDPVTAVFSSGEGPANETRSHGVIASVLDSRYVATRTARAGWKGIAWWRSRPHPRPRPEGTRRLTGSLSRGSGFGSPVPREGSSRRF
jgi:hypothetical protein